MRLFLLLLLLFALFLGSCAVISRTWQPTYGHGRSDLGGRRNPHRTH